MRRSRFGVDGSREFSVHDLVADLFADRGLGDVGGHHALAQIARQECLHLDHRGRIQIVRERPQRRRLEDVDAKTALRGRRDRRELLIGKLRGHISGEQLAHVLRHRTQGGAHLFAHLRRPGRSSLPCRYRRLIPRRKCNSPTTTAPRNEPCTNSK